MYLREKYEKIKTGVKMLVLAYAIAGSLAMLGTDTTGHYSSDLHERKVHLSKLEMKIYQPIFEKLGIENNLSDN